MGRGPGQHLKEGILPETKHCQFGKGLAKAESRNICYPGSKLCLRTLGGSNTGNNSNNQKPPSNVPAGGTNRTSEKYGLPRPPTRCPVCNQGEPHFLATCDMFRSYHNEDMWKIIDKEGVCQFCLKNDVYHKWNECSEKRAKCSKCKWYHHAVLGCRPPRADGGPKNTGRG